MTADKPMSTQIVDVIKAHKEGDTDFSDLTAKLKEASHGDYRNFNKDLEEANKALQEAKLLPGVQLTGFSGNDLVGRSTTSKDDYGEGKAVFINSKNVGEVKEAGGYTGYAGSRDMHINQDGSGTYKLKTEKGGYWEVAQNVARVRGEDGSAKHIAELVKQFQDVNGKKMRAGDTIKIPGMRRDGQDTQFDKPGEPEAPGKKPPEAQTPPLDVPSPKEVVDAVKGKEAGEKFDKIDKAAEGMKAMLDKYGAGYNKYDGYENLTKGRIDKLIDDKDTPSEDKKTLKYMSEHFPELTSGGAPRDMLKDSITFGSINNWIKPAVDSMQARMRETIAKDSLGAFLDDAYKHASPEHQAMLDYMKSVKIIKDDDAYSFRSGGVNRGTLDSRLLVWAGEKERTYSR